MLQKKIVSENLPPVDVLLKSRQKKTFTLLDALTWPSDYGEKSPLKIRLLVHELIDFFKYIQ